MDNLKEHRIITPLNSGFMLISIVGFLVSAFYIPTFESVFPYAFDFAFALGLVFVLMFIASLISMSHAPTLSHLHIDEKRKVKL